MNRRRRVGGNQSSATQVEYTGLQLTTVVKRGPGEAQGVRPAQLEEPRGEAIADVTGVRPRP